MSGTFVTIAPAGATGVNRDLSQHELPISAWTDARNVRFLDGYVHQFYGQSAVYKDPLVVPHHVLPVTVAGQRYWLYLGLEKVYAVSNSGGVTTHTNLTRQTGGVDVNYAGAANKWTSTLLGGIPVLNAGNTVDPPQYWDLNLTHRAAALPNWPANTYCKALRTYRNYLIALGVTKSGTSYPFLVKWSHPADPGAVPASWDQTDATKDAGEYDLAEGEDVIVDGLQLGRSFLIYKEHSVWRMDVTGGAFIFESVKVLGQSGALNVNCIVEVDGFHFVLTNQDVLIHDGNAPVSVLDKVTRRWLFQTMDPAALSTAFVFKNPFFNEVFVCYASLGATAPDRAMVWNYKDRTVSFRDLPQVHHANYGSVDNSLARSWEQDTGTWDSALTLWNGGDAFPPASARVLMASEGQALYLLDAAAGGFPTAYVERRGLGLGLDNQMKLVRGIRPKVTGNMGQTVLVTVGSQNDPWEEPLWDAPMEHVIGETFSNDCLVAGRYIAVRFEAGTAQQWRLDSYDIDVIPTGEW